MTTPLFSRLGTVLVSACLLFFTNCAHAQDYSGNVQASQNYGLMPVYFEPNVGQVNETAHYLTRGSDYTVCFLPTELVLILDVSTNLLDSSDSAGVPLAEREYSQLHLSFEGCNTQAVISAESERAGKANYLIGDDPAQWHTNISLFGRILYQDLYPGIDVMFYGKGQQLEYDFNVSPQTDPSVIRLNFAGADLVEIDENGDLAAHNAERITRFKKPVAYQVIDGNRQEVSAAFALDGQKVTFNLGEYDTNQLLTIDPVLSYSTFLGGAGWGLAVAVDKNGNAYVCGRANGANGLITAGAFQTNFVNDCDAFVAKLNGSGTDLEYMTYLAGNGDDHAWGIAVDSGGNACVIGQTYSGNFPLRNALQPNHGGNVDLVGDGFACKLNTNGSALIYSTYLGGDNADYAQSVVIDSQGYSYICGYGSSGFPLTTNVYKTSGSGFVSKINSNGTAFAYSTFIDGVGHGIAVDAQGIAYVVGEIYGGGINGTNAFQTGFGGGASDGTLFKLSANGRTNLMFSYLGGSKEDYAVGVGLDTNGNIYVSGRTLSANFLITNALQVKINGGDNTSHTDGFVTKVSSSGQVLFSTYFGGANNDDARNAFVQPNGDVLVVGQTGSIDFAPYNNYGSINHGAFDAFIAKINSSGTVLMNFAYLGGVNEDNGISVTADSEGNAYVVGATKSPDYPISGTNVVDPTFNGSSSFNPFITKLYFEPTQLGTKVTFGWDEMGNWNLKPATTLALSNTWSFVSQIASVSSNGVTSLNNNRYQRGASYDPTYNSFLIPLTAQTGVRLDDTGSNSNKFAGDRPWFTRLQTDLGSHLSLVSATNISGVRTSYYNYVTNFSNPIAAFGVTAGGSPLYLNTQIKFGVYCGAQYESTNSDGSIFQAPLRVLVYRLSDFVAGQTNLVGPIATNAITLPRRTLTNDLAAWNQFVTNGYSVTIDTNGLHTTVQLADKGSSVWGVVPQFSNARSGAYVITQEATTNAGYGYVLEGIGVVPLGTNLYPMATNSIGAVAWNRLYAVDFNVRPPWRSVFIDQPHFDGHPLPVSYNGNIGITNSSAMVTNTISLADGSFTNLNSSPELRRHPDLDKFVRDLNNDPLALANYVLNRIELTDALAFNENTGDASAPTLNQGGINRGALAVYREGQGSPVEQCALLVYLLRQAGYPAAFVFPTNNNVQIEGGRLSKLLRMQVHGALDEYGQTFTTNTSITVNYPWVVTTISNSCIHIFPWLKDTELVEGFNLYDYMPASHDNGFKWLRNYIYGDTNILSLYPVSDSPSILFPKFIQKQLQSISPGTSLDDLGVRAFNRQHNYSRWQDFPTPTLVTNQSQVVCVESLTSPAITNVSPALTNIFNTVSIMIYSRDNTNTQMTVGPLRMADLHNRKMFVATNGVNSLMLWLEPFIAGNTNQSAFDATDPALTNKQIQVLTLATNDTSFAIRMTHNRHRSLGYTPTNQFLDITETLLFTTPDRPFNRPDITALCFNVGRVSPAMLDVHATAFQNMTYQWQLNTNQPPAVEDYQAAAAYLMGMDYYAKVGQFLPINERLHKSRVVSWCAEGLSKLTPIRLGAENFMRPSLDMFFSEIAHAGNGTIHPDSGNDYLSANQDFSHLMTAEIAAQEHGLLNGFYVSTNSVSSVVLLRLAQQRAGADSSGILELDKNNYLTLGNTNAVGYGPTKLKDYDGDIWNAVTSAFQAGDADYVRAYITPGPVSLSAASYRGMGLVIVGKSQSASLISINMNGALGQTSGYFGDQQAELSPVSTTSVASRSDFSAGTGGWGGSSGNIFISDPSGSSSDWVWIDSSFGGYGFGPRYRFTRNIHSHATAQGTASATPPSQVDYARQINTLNFYAASTPSVTSLSRALDSGNTGLATSKNLKNYVYDPVNIMSGEFYHDAVDLTLNGPQPLQLRRNYSSQNLGDRNGFGYGWNINIVPYLGMATNATTNVILTAVDPDGSVVAYRQQTNDTELFIPVLSDNPQLDNFKGGRIGSIYNAFNAQIRHSVSGTNHLYTLRQPDGQVRTYVVNSFPISGPTNTIARQRPYLSSWSDSEGNSWAFAFGTNLLANDYGSLTRIQCSNGNFLGFNYNAAGYVVEAYTEDGQRTSYEYNDFGDLLRVVRPDASEEAYEYQYSPYTNNNVIYMDATHLLVKEMKPDGRLLKNVYDAQRRVTVQLATVGTDLNVYTNAVFTYSNNYVMPMTNGITGFTLIKDVNDNTNRYDYTNGLITQITDALNQTIQQNWYATNAMAPGCPRSPWQIKDKRGRWTEFQYDTRGNVTNTFTWGDLAGDGSTLYATNRTAYTSNNLPTQVTDPAGNSVQIAYDPQYPFLPQSVVRLAGGTPVNTNFFVYGNTTNVQVNGYLSITNVAFGLLQQSILAFSSPDAATNQWDYNGRGFLTQQIRFTGTSDPAITNTIFCNNRGQAVELIDGAGRKTDLNYDEMGRITARRIFDNNSVQPIFAEATYYNGNGEVVWTDGPQSSPEDYIYREYDGAGRLTSKIKWRTEARTNGIGIQVPSGYNQYAQTFFEYDKFGNLKRTIDPRGGITTNLWDALGRLVQRKSYDLDGTTILSTEGFSYDSGDAIRFHTNALGSVTETQYTIDGRPRYQRYPDGSTNAWRYYIDGRVRREVQSNGAYWESAYDDVNRIVTRIFYSASNVALATNVQGFDRRGNLIVTTDAAGNSFTNFYDDLNRLKAAVGPAIESVVEACGQTPGCGVYVTNVFQPAITNFFDATGVVLTNVNALNERTISFFDVLGRMIHTEVRSSANVLLQETSAAYAADFHSITITNGSGANAIVSTIYVDQDGQTLLAVGYPGANLLEFSRNTYDLSGNLVYQAHGSATNGTATDFSYATYSYDGLNRAISMANRDNAPTTFNYDAAGNLTNRMMPGGLKWQARFNTAGQLLEEKNVGTGAVATRTNSYIYYPSNSTFAGRLQSRTDGRGVASTFTYDDWLRPATNNLTGILNEQNLTTIWQYDVRGFLTNVAQSFALTATGPDTAIQRTYDLYGRMSSETVSVGGSQFFSAGQGFDTVGNRTVLNLTGASYYFGWRADGLLASVTLNAIGSGTYDYSTAGLLNTRTVGSRVTSVSSRDGAGRPLSVSTSVNGVTKLAETLTWTGDGLPSGHTLVREDFTDSRQFIYANQSRHLIEERLNLDAAKRWTNIYTFDNGAAAGPGVMTAIGQTASASQWNGVTDAFSRIGSETNTSTRQLAYGRVNGPATISASVDGVAQPVSVLGTGDANWTNQWRTTMDLTPGAHQLTVSAAHPSGFFTTNATSWFTNSVGAQTITDTHDAAGNLTQRIWRKPNGTTNLLQTLSWDGKGRLYKVTERDGTLSGRDLTVVYDAFGRRLQTSEIVVTNGIALTNQPLVVSHYFDPMVEFLELALTENGKTTWKLMGPDSDGIYGGQNGTGGFEGEAAGLKFSPTLNDAFGNTHALYNQGTLTWNSSRLAGYGGVPGYRPLALGGGGSLASKFSWRNRASESVGLTWMGGNWLDSSSGRFIAFDPYGHDSSDSGYSFAGGSPYAIWDADGRLGKQWVDRSHSINVNSVASFVDAAAHGFAGAILQGLGSIPSAFSDARADMATASQEISTYTGGKAVLANVLRLQGNFTFGTTALVNDPLTTVPQIPRSIAMLPGNIKENFWNFADAPSVYGAFNLVENGIQAWGVGKGGVALYRTGEGLIPTARPVPSLQDLLAEAEARVQAVKAQYGNVDAYAMAIDYRARFFSAHPELQGKVWVHHAVEQQVLREFPGVVTEAEIHSLSNLRGIPKSINADIHLSQIRIEWNKFYEPFRMSGTAPTKAQLLEKAAEIDSKYGSQFTPPAGNAQ